SGRRGGLVAEVCTASVAYLQPGLLSLCDTPRDDQCRCGRRRRGEGGGPMARTWLSVRVGLVAGRGGGLWPGPGRIFAAEPSHLRSARPRHRQRVRPLRLGPHAYVHPDRRHRRLASWTSGTATLPTTASTARPRR